jgi:hypothetical protein
MIIIIKWTGAAIQDLSSHSQSYLMTMVSQPVCPGVRPPSQTSDHFFLLFFNYFLVTNLVTWGEGVPSERISVQHQEVYIEEKIAHCTVCFTCSPPNGNIKNFALYCGELRVACAHLKLFVCIRSADPGGRSLPAGPSGDVQEGSSCRLITVTVWEVGCSGNSSVPAGSTVSDASRIVSFSLKLFLWGLPPERRLCRLVLELGKNSQEVYSSVIYCLNQWKVLFSVNNFCTSHW